MLAKHYQCGQLFWPFLLSFKENPNSCTGFVSKVPSPGSVTGEASQFWSVDREALKLHSRKCPFIFSESKSESGIFFFDLCRYSGLIVH